MSQVLISGLIGIGSALLTILLTPQLQHYFWKRQHRAEIRLATANQLNDLAAQFLVLYTCPYRGAGKHYPREHTPPDLNDEFLRCWTATYAQVRCLFSGEAGAILERMNSIVLNRDLVGRFYAQVIEEFQTSRDNTLRQLYEEIGINGRRPHG